MSLRKIKKNLTKQKANMVFTGFKFDGCDVCLLVPLSHKKMPQTVAIEYTNGIRRMHERAFKVNVGDLMEKTYEMQRKIEDGRI